MKIKIERETKWISDEVKTSYYVWVDLGCVAMFKTEAEAIAAIESIKSSKHQIGSETIFEEEI
jgi:hypothetical protein